MTDHLWRIRFHPFARTGVMSTTHSAAKRELIEPHPGDKRYVRRDEQGQFKESDDVSKSLAADRRQHSKTVVKKGQGDKGDEK